MKTYEEALIAQARDQITAAATEPFMRKIVSEGEEARTNHANLCCAISNQIGIIVVARSKELAALHETYVSELNRVQDLNDLRAKLRKAADAYIGIGTGNLSEQAATAPAAASSSASSEEAP